MSFQGSRALEVGFGGLGVWGFRGVSGGFRVWGLGLCRCRILEALEAFRFGLQGSVLEDCSLLVLRSGFGVGACWRCLALGFGAAGRCLLPSEDCPRTHD